MNKKNKKIDKVIKEVTNSKIFNVIYPKTTPKEVTKSLPMGGKILPPEIPKEIKKEVIEIPLQKAGKLILSNKVKEYIDTLHREVGSTEWSGILFYKLVSGNIKAKKDLVFQSDFIFPRDIGTASYTSTEASGDIMDAYGIFEDAINCSTALIHSHHNMGAFFSNTDTQELKNNSHLYNYYISLIVNFDGKYCCKISFPGKSVGTDVITFLDENGTLYTQTITTEDSVIFTAELEVVYEKIQLGEQWLLDKIKALKEAKVKKNTYVNQQAFGRGYGGKDLFEYENWNDPDLNPSLVKVPESIDDKDIKKDQLDIIDLFALCVTFSEEAEAVEYKDKKKFMTSELEALCKDDELAEKSLDFIEDWLENLHLEFFDLTLPKEMQSDFIELAELLAIYKDKYGESYFYKEFDTILQTKIKMLD